ncbi:MAG: Uma2 family endonuclease [Planctomycetota bacterium]
MTTSPRIPELCSGDVLTRDEFERRYEAMPHVKKAELIEGVVAMGSPVRLRHHGRPEHLLAGWLAFYESATPGLVVANNTTVRLDLDNEFQPDLLVCVPEHAGGQARIDADDFVAGAPELVVEVAASSVSRDLHQKLAVYRRNGVREYVVHRVDDAAVDWFVLVHGTYERQVPDAQGRQHSRWFPGLCLDVPALLRADLAGVRVAVDHAIAAAAAEHAAFVQRLTG